MLDTHALYAELVRDFRLFLQENYVPGQTLLVSQETMQAFSKTKPVQKKEEAPLVIAALPKAEAPVEKVAVKEKAEPPPPLMAAAPAIAVEPVEELRHTLEQIAPHFKLHSEIPSDAEAKRVASRWKEASESVDVLLLSFGEPEAHLQFLKNLAQAIHTTLMPAKLIDALRIEKEKRWLSVIDNPKIKWIIASEESLGKVSIDLRNFPRAILFAPIAEYFRNPNLKRALWKGLCQRLKS